MSADYGPDLRLTIACFDQRITPVFRGRAGDYDARVTRAILTRRPLGASNLSAALAWAGESTHTRAVLGADGIATAGPTDLGDLQRALRDGATLRRMDVLAFGAVRDDDLLAPLAAGLLARDGVLLDALAPASEWSSRLGRATAADMTVTVADATWTWPTRLEGVQPGDSVLVYAQVPRDRLASGELRIAIDGATPSEHIVKLDRAEAPLLERQWVGARIAQLQRDRAALASSAAAHRAAIDAEVVRLSTSFRVLTPLTALLVLETDSDYARFGLRRDALADVLGVDATGVRVVGRGAPRPHRYARVAAPLVQASARTAPAPTAQDHIDETWGSIRGTVVDQRTGEPLGGVTAVATSPVLAESRAALTNTTGRYEIDQLPPGLYDVTFHCAHVQVSHPVVRVGRARVAPLDARLDATAPGGEAIEVTSRAPTVDTGSMQQRQMIDTDVTQHLPTGRTLWSARGGSAGGDAVARTVAPQADIAYSGMEVMRTQPRALGRSSKRAYTGRLHKVMKLLERGRATDALVESLRWRAEAPLDVMALIALGESLEAKGCAPLAARAYGSIIDLFPTRAQMRRFAASHLARLGPVAAAMAVDSARKAIEHRPDQPTSYRLLAYAYVLGGEPKRAVAVLTDALERTDSRGRFDRARALLRDDLGLVAAVWLAAAPDERADIRTVLDEHAVLVPMEPSIHFVLSWETDANDVDPFVADRGQAFKRTLSRDGVHSGNVRDGWGPEAFVIRGSPPSDFYHVWRTTRAGL